MIGMSSLLRNSNLGMAQHAVGIGVNVAGEHAFGGPDRSFGESVVRGAFWYGADLLVKGASWIPLLAEGAKAGYTAYNEWDKYGQGKIQKYYRAGFGGNFQDTQQAYTMRQRAMAEMQQSRLNARSVLGSEARTFHKSYGMY